VAAEFRYPFRRQKICVLALFRCLEEETGGTGKPLFVKALAILHLFGVSSPSYSDPDQYLATTPGCIVMVVVTIILRRQRDVGVLA
jgi:hypothetical protein